MYCKKCGKEVEDGSTFCPYCGADLREVEENEVEAQPSTDTPAEDNGPWKVFAIIGFVLGIISLAGFFFFAGLATGIPGIVFSILGKKSTNQARKSQASKGLKLAIIGLILSLVVYIIFIVVVALLAASGALDESFLEFLELFGIEVSIEG